MTKMLCFRYHIPFIHSLPLTSTPVEFPSFGLDSFEAYPANGSGDDIRKGCIGSQQGPDSRLFPGRECHKRIEINHKSVTTEHPSMIGQILGGDSCLSPRLLQEEQLCDLS